MSGKRILLLGVGALSILMVGLGIAAIKQKSASAKETSAASAASSATKTSADRSSAMASEAPSPRLFLAQAERALAQGNLLEAKRLYQQVLQTGTDAQNAALTQERLGQVNIKLLFSPTATPDSIPYTVESGDTLSKIAKKFHTTVELIKASNQLALDQIRLGQRLKVVKANFNIIVDKSQNTLILKNAEEVLKVYRCSTGQGGITPAGNFRIKNRLIDPPWFTPQGVIPPGDPRNVLGSRWLGFDLPSYGIHGTTDPTSIGKSVTQGCVRLSNADVEELFALVPVETPVTIVE